MCFNVKFPFFKGTIQNIYPSGEVSLMQFIRAQQNPKDNLKSIFNQIAHCESIGDFETKGKLKEQNLFYFTPCVNVKHRSYDGILSFTGLLVLDFDHIERADDFRDFLFENCKYVICCYTSPSKSGVKVIVKIPIVKTVEEFKSYFYGLAHYMSRFEGFDATAQNPTLALFTSWDENIRWREDAITWTKKGEKVDSFKVYEGVIETVENVTLEDKNKIYLIAKSHLLKANQDFNGHPKIVSMAVAIGGYIAAGYLTQAEGELIMFKLIDKIDYYQKNKDGYKKTAKDMIVRGMSSPLYLKED